MARPVGDQDPWSRGGETYSSVGEAIAVLGPRIVLGDRLTAEQWAEIRRAGGDDPWEWIEKAVCVAGRALGTLSAEIGGVIVSAAELVGKVPIIGGAFSAILIVASGPFMATAAIIKGERIDKVVLARFKDVISAVREVAPLAKTIISFIPGVGAGVNAALAIGMVLAEGGNITDALIEGVKGAIPGGQLAQAAFEVTQAAIRGENIIDGAVGASLKMLPPVTRDALKIAYGTAKRGIKGENLALSALDEARNALPLEARMAIDVGVAIGQGRNLQEVVISEVVSMGPEGLSRLAGIGKEVIKNNPIFEAGKKNFGEGSAVYQWGKTAYEDVEDIVKSAGQEGYAIAIGVMSRSGVTESDLLLIRSKLGEIDRIAFDSAVANYIGQVTTKLNPITYLDPTKAREAAVSAAKTMIRTPSLIVPSSGPTEYRKLTVYEAQQRLITRPLTTRTDALQALAAAYTVIGMVGASPDIKARIMVPISKVEPARQGALVAIKQVEEAKGLWGLWFKIKKFFVFLILSPFPP